MKWARPMCLKFPILTVQLENNVDLELKPNMYMRNGGVFCDDNVVSQLALTVVASLVEL